VTVELDPVEQRVLGSLLEKQRTVPATYPLSLNALRAACNQATSREPVTDYDEQTITDAIGRLKGRGLARVVWAGAGSRVLKYHQLLDEVLALQPDERALVTVLLLRGPQSAGELRTRAERLHGFDDKAAVEARLHAMAALPTPLVRELPRRPGQQDPRWVHLLGPVPLEPAAAAAEVDREVVLAAGPAARDARVVASYDLLAEAPDAPDGDLGDKPFDGWLLEQVVGLARGGRIADIGCGHGQVTAHLAAAGAAVTGFDLSAAMVARAQADHPDLPFEVAHFGRLLRPRDAAGWSAITAWYAFPHLAGSELGPAVATLAGTLLPGGWLALAVQLGDEVRHLDEWGDQPVDLDVVLHDQGQVLAAVAAAGLGEVEWYTRSPCPGEDGTSRLYVLARRTG
jgi:uncharacterized protein YceH (UPF0502 family)/SAM-dependent methyltransferase